jgi:hypothetical protein
MPHTPFSYSDTPDNVNSFSMTPGNSAPALVVWLFMLTTKRFLPALQASAADVTKIKFKDASGNTIDLNDISQITNLAREALVDLFNMYLLPNTTAQVRKSVQKAFGNVAAQFQAFATTHSTNWDEDECPGVIGLKQLAASGAPVDPVSYQNRNKKAKKQTPTRATKKTAKGRKL